MIREPMAGPAVSDAAFEAAKMIVELVHDTRARRARGPRTSGLSQRGIRAAIHLAQHGEQTIGELASGLGISRGWASRVVDELHSAGYVVSERSTADRRTVRVRLDPSADEHIQAEYRWRADAIESALAPFDEEERSAILSFLRRLIDGLR